MPASGTVKRHYKRLLSLRRRFQAALNEAHMADVIKYEDQGDSPCDAFWECWERVEKTTGPQLQQAMRDEIRKELDQ